MTNSQFEQSGLTFFEVLISILILSITIVGFMNLQSILFNGLDNAKKQLEAEHIAFQLIDIYPQDNMINLPDGWSYKILAISKNKGCSEIRVILQPNLGNQVTQVRLFCP